jgi:hypothetical protein
MVIVITSSAPGISGGAGDGIPNARQAKPKVKASKMPIAALIAHPAAPASFPEVRDGRR